MNNDLFYGMDSCCKVINGIFNNLLSIPIKVPGNRANPRLKFTKKTQYKDRYIYYKLYFFLKSPYSQLLWIWLFWLNRPTVSADYALLPETYLL